MFYIFISLFLVMNFGSSFIFNTQLLSVYRKIVKNHPPQFDPFEHRKLIITTPGGLNGFYLLGINSYIKQNYNLTNFVFSGASAGAWNSLFLSHKGNDSQFLETIFHPSIYNVTSIYQIEKNIKFAILNNYNTTDFDLNKIYIGVGTLTPRSFFKLVIYNDFFNLEDILDCCIASSHIPFITGGIFHFYRKKISFDGGIYSYPYLTSINPSLMVNPSLWNSSLMFSSNCTLINILNTGNTSVDVNELFSLGYNDSLANKGILDSIFL